MTTTCLGASTNSKATVCPAKLSSKATIRAAYSEALGGAIRDAISGLATAGTLGPALDSAATGYSFVYHIELVLLFATLIAIGPLVRSHDSRPTTQSSAAKFGLAELPG